MCKKNILTSILNKIIIFFVLFVLLFFLGLDHLVGTERDQNTRTFSQTTQSTNIKKGKTNKRKATKISISKEDRTSAVNLNKLTTDVAEQLQTLKTRYRNGEISKLQFWIHLTKLEQLANLPKNVYLDIMQQKAILLYEQNYYISSGIYVVNLLKELSNPFDEKYIHFWKILDKVSHYHSSFYLLENLAKDLEELKLTKLPPVLETNWYYFVGNVLESQQKYDEALEVYKKLKISDAFFLPAQYQIALIQIEKGRFDLAENALKAILTPVSQNLSPYKSEILEEISNYAKIALARMYYQKSEFKKSIIFYRAVDRDSIVFYDSLWEQAWAFFMAGYPNHALGALHGADSPFFADRFNPEISMLRAIIYYWMCRYDDGKFALAEFVSKHSKEIENLNDFLSRKNLNEQMAYMLFENFISGVSENSLGMSKRILKTAAEQDSMKLLREQYAFLVAEINKLEAKGIYGNTQYISEVRAILYKLLDQFKMKIGLQFLKELTELKAEYDRLYEQSQFLYIELLMSQKEQIYGRELHADTKIDKISSKKDIIGWGDNTQSWGDKAYRGEYWADEIGFYIYNVKPMCKIKTH